MPQATTLIASTLTFRYQMATETLPLISGVDMGYTRFHLLVGDIVCSRSTRRGTSWLN